MDWDASTIVDGWDSLFWDAVVATDDERIADCCREFGADVIMTLESCKNGAFRVLQNQETSKMFLEMRWTKSINAVHFMGLELHSWFSLSHLVIDSVQGQSGAMRPLADSAQSMTLW